MADPEDPGKLADQTVVQKLFSEIGPRYADRPGGYTRLIHLPERRIGDAGAQVLLQLVEETQASADRQAGPTQALWARLAAPCSTRTPSAMGSPRRLRPEPRRSQTPIRVRSGWLISRSLIVRAT